MTQSSTKLFEQVRQMMRLKHYAYSTEKSYLNWIRRFIIFHDLRHPRTLGKDQIESFLSHLAVRKGRRIYPKPSAQCTALPLSKRPQSPT